MMCKKDNYAFNHDVILAEICGFSSIFLRNIHAIPRRALSATALRAPPRRRIIVQPLPKMPANDSYAPCAPIHA